MNPSNQETISLTVERRIDQTCLDFEAELQASLQQATNEQGADEQNGDGPRIESYLEKIDGDAERQRSLCELLAIEIEFRVENDLPVDADEYTRRFPDQNSLITGLIAQTVADTPSTAGHVLKSTVNSTASYTLTQMHSEGGLGQVWVAHDSTMNRDVALKKIKPRNTRDREAWQRFLKEAQITGQLEHPGIVPVYALCNGDDATQSFYTMRFVNGQTLKQAIVDFRKMPFGNEARLPLLSRSKQPETWNPELGTLNLEP